MSISMSAIARTQLDQTYRALDGILAKAAEHAAGHKVDEAIYLDWRLTPDMFALKRQVQLVSDFSVRGLSRLAGQEPASLADTETSFADLRARLAAARAAIWALPVAAIDADPMGEISFPAGPGKEMTLPRQAYVQNFMLANVLFHASMVYAILRSIGVPVGKRDFLAVPG
ncbi:DUF1993 family protein [Maricaulis sp.]|uniref:DUF1993 family protein n=1 Tax=Maricaulis sp. TaxID=1486257 RepID=UPI003A8DF641